MARTDFANQSQSVVRQNQSNHQITFDTQFKTSLFLIATSIYVLVIVDGVYDLAWVRLPGRLPLGLRLGLRVGLGQRRPRRRPRHRGLRVGGGFPPDPSPSTPKLRSFISPFSISLSWSLSSSSEVSDLDRSAMTVSSVKLWKKKFKYERVQLPLPRV